MRTLQLSLSLVLGAGLLAGCTADEDPDANATPGNKTRGAVGIAVVGPMSGPNALIGEEITNVSNMVFGDAENMIGEREVELFFVDSASDPMVAVENYESIVADPENNIVAGFFNWHSDVSLALMDVAADEGLAHVAALGATGEINDKYTADRDRYAGWTKGWATPTKLGANYVTAVEDAIAAGSFDVSGGRTVAIYGEETSWGRGFGGGMRESLEAAGWTVVAEVYVDAEGTDFQSTIDELNAAQPRLIAGTIATGSIYTFVSQIRETFPLDAQPLIIADGLGWNSDWYQTLGDTSNGIVDQIPQFATQEAQDFAARYRDDFGGDASPSAGGLTHDYAKFAIKILEAAGEEGAITRENVMTVMRDQVLKGDLDLTDGILMSRYTWNSESAPDPVVGGDAFTFPVLQYSSGESRVVWPESLKTSDANIE